MSIIKVYQDDTESFSVIAHPHRTFSSGSSLSTSPGVTGSVYVFPRRSPIERSMAPVSSFLDSRQDDADVQTALMSVMRSVGTTNLEGALDEYMQVVNEQVQESRKTRYHDVLRFTPTTEYTKDTARKLVVKDVLDSFYRVKYPSAHWGYTNYNCLSFFTASTFPESSVLLYPNLAIPLSGRPLLYGTISGFTFDFYINPCHRGPDVMSPFHAGTIFHLSSSYAVSLISGSRKDGFGRPDSFRLQLQLSHSADIRPSEALPTAGPPGNLVFLSDDNALDYNKWHHVVIRWGTSKVDRGTGSIMIDAGDGLGLLPRGTFVVPSASLLQPPAPVPSPGVLCVGNFYEGSNTGGNAQALWFATDPAAREGLVEMVATPATDEPAVFRFAHPLNADIHDVSITPKFLSEYELSASEGHGPTDVSQYAFYLGPLFVREAPLRRFVGWGGGVLQTPFFALDGTTVDAFNVPLSFGVAGHDINLENFVKDLANDLDPRCFYLTASAITTSTVAEPCNNFLWSMDSCVKRNMLLMPCDDGTFVPNFDLVITRPINPLSSMLPLIVPAANSRLIVDDGLSRSKYVDSLGNLDTSLISLDDMVVDESAIFNTDNVTLDSVGNDVKPQTWSEEQVGPTPELMFRPIGPALAHYSSSAALSLTAGTFMRSDQDAAPYTVYQRTKDGSSNEVVFFDVSNLYYGMRIMPKSLTITDTSLSGSSGHLGMVLKDDGFGSLYRATSSGTLATWNSVGSVFYDEGIVVVKSPHLFQFGKDYFKFDFKGEQAVHVLTVDVVAGANQLNSSSNPSFRTLSASLYHNDNDREFVYISGINFHDENLNVVMRTQLAQPIIKRHGERIVCRCKMDF